MELLLDHRDGVTQPSRVAPAPDERAARRTLRRQIASLERQLSDAFLTAFSMREFGLHRESPAAEPRLLDLGEPGCGAWEVRPRLGLIGMLMGWWQVKLSSGCPLAGGRGQVTVARINRL